MSESVIFCRRVYYTAYPRSNKPSPFNLASIVTAYGTDGWQVPNPEIATDGRFTFEDYRNRTHLIQGTPASNNTATVTNAYRSSVPGCEATNECFIPHTVTIDAGGEVTWLNADTAAHTITSGTSTDGADGAFDSGLASPGAEFKHVFDEVGEYPYFCLVHPWMAGLVVVENPIPTSSQMPDVALRPGVKQGIVTKIVDGDTVDISSVRCRLNLIDTPERDEPGFWNATNEVKRLCPQGSVIYYDDDAVTPLDRYGRHLGVIWCEGNDYQTAVGERLYNLGLAGFYHRFCDTTEAATDRWAAIHGNFYRETCYGDG